MEPFETIKHRGYIISLYQDSDPYNPREDDNLGKMVCKHRDYDLGDKSDYGKGDYGSLTDLVNEIEQAEGKIEWMPLYLLDHSGLWMQTGRFNCDAGGWDTSLVGLIFVSHKAIEKEYEKLDDITIDRARKQMDAEVQTYSDYLSGAVCGWVISNPRLRLDHISSAWGYIGEDGRKQAEADAKATIACDIKERRLEAKQEAYSEAVNFSD